MTRPDEGTEDELPLNDADRVQIVELYQQRLPATEIAEQFGISRETVYTVLRRAGVPTHAETRTEPAEFVLSSRQNAFAQAMRDMLREQGALAARLEAIERRLERLERGGEHTTEGT